ncbi:MAG: ABC transporter permease [Candidatus Heimdallarchaeota archaeon]|nr:ABC transporter permease [Candidatus Heimdallarchaeota archaeon]
MTEEVADVKTEEIKKSRFKRIRENSVLRILFKVLLAMEALILILFILNIPFVDMTNLPSPYFLYFHIEVWKKILSTTVFAKMIVAGVPIMITAVGAAFNEKAGVINIGLEGIMIFGAWAAVYFAWSTGNPWLGLLGALMFGFFASLIHAVMTITFKSEQIVTGVAINLLALGITEVMTNLVWGTQFSPPIGKDVKMTRIDIYDIPVLGFIFKIFTLETYYGIPVLGDILEILPDVVRAFDRLNPMIYIAFLLVPICHYLLFRTSIGLRIRVIGEHPQAAATAGINVHKYQYFAVILSGVLAAFGGAILSLGITYQFRQGLVGGRGFIALAAMIFGKWKVKGSAAAALLFGYFFALQIDLGFVRGFEVPKPFVQMIPYLVTLVALAGFIGDAIPPKNIGNAYDPKEGH